MGDNPQNVTNIEAEVFVEANKKEYFQQLAEAVVAMEEEKTVAVAAEREWCYLRKNIWTMPGL
ncbi:hypothetical protein [Sporomusa sp. KB1]|uniref:hypothetical protein n=1 Tax=Sporomusa sp. KB1 TaxID=943346 RepID=UPI001C974870|nr:hypothetical protein [Sporomusa sp. KB1]